MSEPDRTLLVPSQWGGSVEHFYHFLLGYLYPVVLHLEETGDSRITVRDCGPLTTWFTLLEHRCDLEVIPAGTMLHRFVRQSQRSVVLPPLDDPDSFDGRPLATFRDAAMAAIRPTPVASQSSCVILQRAQGDPFYASTRTEIPTTGAERRSIPNVAEVLEAVQPFMPATLLAPERADPLEQIGAIAPANVLVGQHGAGMAHMLWMDPGSLVVEIQPPLEDAIRAIFGKLAHALSLEYRTIEQESEHAPVSPATVAATITAFAAARRRGPLAALARGSRAVRQAFRRSTPGNTGTTPS